MSGDKVFPNGIPCASRFIMDAEHNGLPSKVATLIVRHCPRLGGVSPKERKCERFARKLMRHSDIETHIEGLYRRKDENGASEGIRTLDTHVGNVMLYQAELRSLPEGKRQTSRTRRICKPDFKLACPNYSTSHESP